MSDPRLTDIENAVPASLLESVLSRRLLLGGAVVATVALKGELRASAFGRHLSPSDQVPTSQRISVTDYIPESQREAILTGKAVYDCTRNIQDAVEDVKRIGGTLYFPDGKYLVESILFDGGGYSVEIGPSVSFQQRAGNPEGRAAIRIENAHDIIIGDLMISGNIASDNGEHHHAVTISGSRNIRIGNIFASNVRGDALYCSGRVNSESESLSEIYVESISGNNVFRNLLSVVGGNVRVGSVINAGPVGHRDIDVEPNNAFATYQPVTLLIDRAEVGSVEITSDDAEVINRSVRFGTFHADLNRVRPTNPPYPQAPGENAYALNIARTKTVRIDRFTARNYNVYALSLSSDWSLVDIGIFEIVDCSLNDPTYNTMILQQGDAQGGELRIGNLICDASRGKYLARVHNQSLLRVNIAKIEKMKCLVGTQLTGRIANGTIDLNHADGAAMVNCGGITLNNITILNGTNAVGFYRCVNVSINDSEISFKTLSIDSKNIDVTKSIVDGISVSGKI